MGHTDVIDLAEVHGEERGPIAVLRAEVALLAAGALAVAAHGRMALIVAVVIVGGVGVVAALDARVDDSIAAAREQARRGAVVRGDEVSVVALLEAGAEEAVTAVREQAAR